MKQKKIIKQHSVVECLGCLLDENMSGEAMARMILKKVNGKKNFFIDKVDIYRIHSKECYATL